MNILEKYLGVRLTKTDVAVIAITCFNTALEAKLRSGQVKLGEEGKIPKRVRIFNILRCKKEAKVTEEKTELPIEDPDRIYRLRENLNKLYGQRYEIDRQIDAFSKAIEVLETNNVRN